MPLMISVYIGIEDNVLLRAMFILLNNLQSSSCWPFRWTSVNEKRADEKVSLWMLVNQKININRLFYPLINRLKI